MKIEIVEIENIDTFDLVNFNLTTKKGAVLLSEYVTINSCGYIYVEKTDSNIKCNMIDEFKRIVDDDVDVNTVLQYVEHLLNNKYTIEDQYGHTCYKFAFIDEVKEQLEAFAKGNVLSDSFVRNIKTNEFVVVNTLDDIEKIYSIK